MRIIIGFLFMLMTQGLHAQQYYGIVKDGATRQPLPFAVLKVNDGKNGTVADLNGVFTIQLKEPITLIECSYLGYSPVVIRNPKANDSIRIQLKPAPNLLNELVFKPPYDKIRRIINLTIANRSKNNPELYDQYRCQVYYKMVVDAKPSDSAYAEMLRDTSRDAQMSLRFINNQHFLVTETYSIRSWKRPQMLQEEVRASRFSGLKKSIFTNLVTDVLPFHAYSDYLNLNAKDYHNPIAKGYGQRYEFNLTDEIIQGDDTLWLLSFRPRTNTFAGLKGTVYISSNGYAIANLLASAWDETLKRDIRLEHQYQFIAGKWFPKELNYILEFSLPEEQKKKEKADAIKSEKTFTRLVMKGNSRIDSISFARIPDGTFNKRYPIKLLEGADVRTDSLWQLIRPEALSSKEAATYQFNDSLGDALKFDRYTPYLEKLVYGKLPLGPIDVNIDRLYRFNRYEGSRLGLGIQTGDKVSKYFSVGGWYGYGFKDKDAKYGAFADVYLDKYRDYTLTVSYSRDIRDPGRLQINPEIDRNSLRMFLINRADLVTTYALEATQRLGYWSTIVAGRVEQIVPRYDYRYRGNEGGTVSFDAREVSLAVRYAFAERRVPLFGRYLSTGSRYPMLYGKLTGGNITGTGLNTNYIQAIAAVSWQKHLNRVGQERLLLLAGKTWSADPLPISKLFAGNGFRFDQGALYAFGGMLTLYPYDMYMDEFVNVYWRHDFDRRLYNIGISAPTIALQHNMLVGNLSNQTVHERIQFRVPAQAYHESGVMLNGLLRYKYFNVYYLSFNTGYFYHWTSEGTLKDNGRFVLGLGVDF